MYIKWKRKFRYHRGGCILLSSVPVSLSFSLYLSRGPRLRPLKLQCIAYIQERSGPRKGKQYPRTHLLHTHAAYGGDGYRGIRARTDTQGNTLMARATGGSSKVTYPRKPHVSFPFYSVGRSRPTYIYLHTFLSVTVPRPPPTTTATTKRTGIIWPEPACMADKPPLSDTRPIQSPGVCKRALA